MQELELTVSARFLFDTELSPISSITSTNIEKITINRNNRFIVPVTDTIWKQLDNILTKLVERSEYKLKLEVELRGHWNIRGKVFDRKESRLPKFVKKGRMMAWGCRDELVYCSDGPMERM